MDNEFVMKKSQYQEICEMPWYREDKEYGDVIDSDDEDWGYCSSSSEDEDVDTPRRPDSDNVIANRYRLSLMLDDERLEI